MTTPTRKIGDDEFSPIGFGAMGLSTSYGKVDNDEDRFKILDRAHELGCTFWDTADVYLDSEDLLGKWFKRSGKRGDIFLSSKFGYTERLEIRGDAAYVKEAAERSLKRLGIDYVDMYYLHRVDKNTPIEETVGALAELVKAGKIKHVGISECTSNGLRRAHAIHPISAIEVEYSPFMLAIEDDKIGLLKTARELGVKIVAYSPLGRGLLTGQYKSVNDFEDDDFRRMLPTYVENFPRILGIAGVLKAIGEKHKATAGQVALAWLLAQGDDVIPIPGTKKLKYLEENLAASKIKLSQEELGEVRKAIASAGLTNMSNRYPPVMMDHIFVDSPPLKK